MCQYKVLCFSTLPQEDVNEGTFYGKIDQITFHKETSQFIFAAN